MSTKAVRPSAQSAECGRLAATCLRGSCSFTASRVIHGEAHREAATLLAQLHLKSETESLGGNKSM